LVVGGFHLITSAEDVRDILERILISYGVTTRQAYADLVGIPIGTVNNWLKRNSLPGDYLVQCALDTGADVVWLKKGNLANASLEGHQSGGLSGIALSEKIEASGGKIALSAVFLMRMVSNSKRSWVITSISHQEL